MVRQYEKEMRRRIVMLSWEGLSPRQMKLQNPHFAPHPQTIRKILREWAATRCFDPPRKK